jgi:hypothetical protein
MQELISTVIVSKCSARRAFARAAAVFACVHTNSEMPSALEAFEFEGEACAIDVYNKYIQYREQITAMQIGKVLQDAYLAVLNKAYDLALSETTDARDAAQSPRRS